ncbi:MAG: glycosyltransferase [Bacteroidota bacterium]|nr:glycosyltransferase [Bacteroidota bacterium]
MMKKISIITINYNNAAGLEKTILSVTNQRFKDFEFILVDGGSNDGSCLLLEKYKSQITNSVSEKDNGVYHAQNKGIRLASAEYCLFLNSGDTLNNEDVLQAVILAGMTADIVYGDMLIDDGNKQIRGNMPDQLTFEHMIKDTLWHPVSFIKRSLFDQYGFYREDLKVVSDYDFFLKTILVHKVCTKHIPIVISVFQTDGLSSKPENEALIRRERKEVQLNYFSEKKIDAVFKLSLNDRILRKIKQWFRS